MTNPTPTQEKMNPAYYGMLVNLTMARLQDMPLTEEAFNETFNTIAAIVAKKRKECNVNEGWNTR